MNERVLQFRVGVVVVAGVVITGILIVLFGEGAALLNRYYAIHVHYVRAPGVTVNTPVRKSGVLIGRVTQVRLKEKGGVVVSAKINTQFKLFDNETCRIASGSLLGDAVLDIMPGDAPAAPAKVVEDGDTMKGELSSNPLDVLVNLEGNMKGTLDSMKLAGEEIGLLAKNVNAMLGDKGGGLDDTVANANVALKEFTTAMQSINQLMGDDQFRERLKASLADIPDLLADTRAAMNSFQSMSELANENLVNITGLTKPLGEQGGEIVSDVSSSVDALRQALEHLADLTGALGESKGTISMLLRDPDLYLNLEKASQNIKDASGKLVPILSNLNTFTDKIARNPGRIVSGALNPKKSGTKYNVPAMKR